MKIDAAYILCAGLGTRMGQIGTVLPKPLWPLFEKTCLDFIIMQVQALGITNIFINTHHLAGQIEEHVKSNKQTTINVLHEPILLGSGGAIHNLKRRFPEVKKVLVLNADFFFLLTPVTLRLALEKMQNATSLLFCITVPFGSGLNQVCIDNGLLKKIVQASMIKPCISYETYAGISILNLETLEYQEGVSTFFDSVANFENMNVPVFLDHGIEWYDVGTKQSYKAFYYEFSAKWPQGKRDVLSDTLIANGFLLPQKFSDSGSYSAFAGSKRVFNFDPDWNCLDPIPSDTFILKAPSAPIVTSGIYFREYVDKN
ncbi:MAG: hypothetical protein A2X86_04765 [Bdellovibrionales bacterium GWA2_49_15]|nr:MAG: hypothetical protein A2X86_04765 [Bdellovibrionales bacterium GWA2_49_15]